MRTTKHQLVAGYPALKVRAFLRRYRVGTFVAPAAEDAFQVNAEQAAELLAQLVALGLIEPVEPKTVLAESGFELTSSGQAFASASAAKPVLRKTAETLLQEFRKWCDRRRYPAREQGRTSDPVLTGSSGPGRRFLKRFGRGRVLSVCTELMTSPRWWMCVTAFCAAIPRESRH